MSRFGLQPARRALYDERWSIARAAEQINVPPRHLAGAVYGSIPPSQPVRDRLPILLHQPLSALFTEDALAATYQPQTGRNARQRRDATWLTGWDAR